MPRCLTLIITIAQARDQVQALSNDQDLAQDVVQAQVNVLSKEPLEILLSKLSVCYLHPLYYYAPGMTCHMVIRLCDSNGRKNKTIQ